VRLVLVHDQPLLRLESQAIRQKMPRNHKQLADRLCTYQRMVAAFVQRPAVPQEREDLPVARGLHEHIHARNGRATGGFERAVPFV